MAIEETAIYECIKQYRSIEIGTIVQLEYYAFNIFIIMNGNNHPTIDKNDILKHFKHRRKENE